MSRPAPRLHRLPQRKDYILIPAPLDLSLSEVTEKSPLPAIIVTPSSPSSSRDFSIAFLASPPKPSLRHRFREHIASSKILGTPLPVKARSILIVLVIIFVLVCHLATHRLAARRPHLALTMQTGESHVVDSSSGLSWYDFRSLFGSDVDAAAGQVHRDYIISDSSGTR
ncbi:hypothetical protein B0H34DRAFT_742038 [Crassisporium funariophilum]|nr:hypothetical protein B0H34DRAFT_742038 [Crassisporium funariophilum]